MGGAKSRKMSYCSDMRPLYFACIYFHLFIPHVWSVMHKCSDKNTAVIEKCLSLIYLFSLSKKDILSYITKQLILLKKCVCVCVCVCGGGGGRFIGPQEQWFRLKKGCLFRPKSAKGGYFSNLGTSMVYALVGRGMPGMVSVRKNSPRPYYWHR